VESYTYDPYGNVLSQNPETELLFKGEQLDENSGLYYMRARYYDPIAGIFISKDPVEGVLTDAQSQHGYSYSHNDPINLSDPSGQYATIIEKCLPIAQKIAGYTNHGLQQAIGRDGGKGVNPQAMLDAVRTGKVIEQANGVVKYVGDKATVILNEAGQVITTYGQPRNP
jgi:RHS repeat-associated protein